MTGNDGDRGPNRPGYQVTTLRGGVIDPLTTQVGDDFAHLTSSLDDWEGEAAAQFSDYFYSQVELSVRNQAFAAEAVCVGLAGRRRSCTSASTA